MADINGAAPYPDRGTGRESSTRIVYIRSSTAGVKAETNA